MNSVLAAVLIGTVAIAAAAPVLALDLHDQVTSQPPTSSDETGAIDRVPLELGKNSFTESQAKARLEGAGFTHVGALVLDEQGIWRGTADKGAMTVNVGLDFKGRIAADNARAQ